MVFGNLMEAINFARIHLEQSRIEFQFKTLENFKREWALDKNQQMGEKAAEGDQHTIRQEEDSKSGMERVKAL